jgi:hypothetical protein
MSYNGIQDVLHQVKKVPRIQLIHPPHPAVPASVATVLIPSVDVVLLL